MESSRAADSPEPSAAGAFELVWDTLVGVLGTAATATMFRRAAKNAARNRPDLRELHGLEIRRDGLDYRCVLPPSWSSRCEECFLALTHLIRDELCPVLAELTGPVVIRLLERQPELQRTGILGEQGSKP